MPTAEIKLCEVQVQLWIPHGVAARIHAHPPHSLLNSIPVAPARLPRLCGFVIRGPSSFEYDHGRRSGVQMMGCD